MPEIKLYNRLLPHHELGEAELTVDNLVYDVSNQSFAEMLTIYEPDIRAADKAVLSSSEVGTWKYVADSRKWERLGI